MNVLLAFVASLLIALSGAALGLSWCVTAPTAWVVGVIVGTLVASREDRDARR